MTKLTIKERHVEDVTILDMAGNVTVDGNTIILQTAIRRLLQEGHLQILLNLADIAYLDSSGLGELAAGHTILNRAGGQLKLLHLTPKVRDLLSITRLLTIFDVYEDESTAVNSFKAAT